MFNNAQKIVKIIFQLFFNFLLTFERISTELIYVWYTLNVVHVFLMMEISLHIYLTRIT